MLNRVCFQGRLTADPELSQTQSGVAYCNFTVAWSEKYKETENKCFLRCKTWRQTSEFVCKYFTKGQEIIVEGKLNTDEWTDKDGNKKSATCLSVDQVNFCGGKRDSTGSTTVSQNSPQTAVKSVDIQQDESKDNDDLPF